MSLPSRLAVLCVGIGVLLCGAPAAQAACTTSTPSSTTFADPANDVDGTGPDMTAVKLTLDAACTFAFDPGISAVTAEDVVVTYIDNDGNRATGDPDVFGTDLATVSFGDGLRAMTFFAWWDGSAYTVDETNVVETAPTPGGFSIAVDRLAIPSGATAAFRVIAMRLGETEFGFDLAPEPESMGAITLPVTYEGTPAAPTLPAPQTGQQGGSPSPLPQLPTTRVCTVPKVKGRTLAGARTRLTASGCTPAVAVTRRYSNAVRKGRVIGTTPGPGSRTTKKVKLIVSRGKRPKRAAASAARQELLTRAQALLRARQRASIAGISS